MGHLIIVVSILRVDQSWILEHGLVLEIGRVGGHRGVGSMVALFLLQKVQLLVLLTLLLLKLHLLQFQLLLAKFILLSPNIRLLDSQLILL